MNRAARLGVAQAIGEHEKLRTLLRLGAVREQQMAAAYAQLLGVPRLEGQRVDTPPVATERFARHYGVVTLSESASHLQVAAAVPLSDYALKALGYQAAKQVELVVGTRDEITALIEQAYGEGRSAMGALIQTLDDDSIDEGDIEQLKDMASEAPVIRLVNLMLQHAVDRRASDIHVEPFETQLKVRYRVDGVLVEGEAPRQATPQRSSRG